MNVINKSYKESNKELGLYSGIFWIVDSDNVLNNDDYCFTISCDISGNPVSLEGLNAKSGTTYNHELTWKTLSPKLTYELVERSFTFKEKKNDTNKNLDESINIQSIVPDRTEEGIIICPDAWEDGWK